MLFGRIILSVAAANDCGSMVIFQSQRQFEYIHTNFERWTHTFPAFLSSMLKCEIGATGSVNFFSIPLKPSPKIALNAKNGLTSAPVTRISKRVAAGGTAGGEMTLTEAARES